MSPRIPIDWQKLKETVQPLEAKAWQLICERGTIIDERRVNYSGYTIRGGFQNFSPRLVFVADLVLAEERQANSTKIDRLMEDVLDLCITKGLRFKLGIEVYAPMIGSLERDKVYGPDPEVPPRIDYAIRPIPEDVANNFRLEAIQT